MHNNSTLLTPARATYVIALSFRTTRTSGVSGARLCAPGSHDTLRRVRSQKVPWSRRRGEPFARRFVLPGGYLVIEDTSGERFPRVADAVSGGWASRGGKPGWGRQVGRW